MWSSIRVRLFVGFLAVVFLAGIISLMAIVRLSQLVPISLSLIEEEIPEVHLLWNIKILLSEMESDLERLLLNQEQQKYLLPAPSHCWKEGVIYFFMDAA